MSHSPNDKPQRPFKHRWSGPYHDRLEYIDANGKALTIEQVTAFINDEPGAGTPDVVVVPRKKLAQWESWARVRGYELHPNGWPDIMSDGLADEMKAALDAPSHEAAPVKGFPYKMILKFDGFERVVEGVYAPPSTALPATGETPRTDAARRNSRTLDYEADGDVVLMEVAEQLERELAAERKSHGICRRALDDAIAQGEKMEAMLDAAPSSTRPPDAGAWDGNAHGLTALLEENKRLKELAERQTNDAEAAWLELAEFRLNSERAIAALSATRAPTWIPVSERLPSEPRDAIICLAYAPTDSGGDASSPGAFVASYDGGEWCCRMDAGCWEPGEVTHWMPFPGGPTDGGSAS